MNDLFRAIFGAPDKDHNEERTDGTPLDNSRNNFTGDGGDDDGDDDDDDDDDNMRTNSRGGMGFFGFPFLNDPVDIHKHFERVVSEMNKTFGIFGFGSVPSISWEDENSNLSSSHINNQPQQKQENLRDFYLKQPDCSCDKAHQNDVNVNINIEDMEPSTSDAFNSETQFSFPKVYSKSVFIQTVRRPDGSVETIKKVRDHTGNEKTTITQSSVNDPLPPPEENDPTGQQDTSGISIFKKFFPF